MSLEVSLQLTDRSADDQELDDLTSQLRADLLDAGVDDAVPLTGGPAPRATRGLDVAVIGGLLVSIGQSSEAIGRLVSAVRDWLKRDPEPARTVHLTLGDRSIELTGASSEQQDRLIAEFIRAASTGSSGGG